MPTAETDFEARRDTHSGRRWRGLGMVVFAAALLGGLVLRVVAPSPLWLDEALSVNIAQLGFGDAVDALRHDGHPALYYLLLGWWIDLFGDSDGAVRAFSGVCSLLTVPVVWCIARRHEPPTAPISLGFALASPFLLRYGTEARMYALVVLLVAVGWLAALVALDRATAARLAGLAATAAALVHTNYWAFWVVGAAILVLGWEAGRRTGTERTDTLRVGGAILVGAATIVVWLGVLYDQATSTGTPWASRARPAEVAVETMQAIGGSDRFEGVLLGVALVVLGLIGATAVEPARGSLTLSFGRRLASVPAVMIVLTLALGTLVALANGSAFEARHAAVVVPFVLVLAARGTAMLPVPAATVVLAGITLFGLAVGIDNSRRDRTQGQEVADAIDSLARPDDVVVFCPDQVGPATTRTLDHSGPRLAYPSGDGSFVDWADYLDRIAAVDTTVFANQVDEMAADHTVWLVAGFGYRGFDGRCEAIIDTLGATRVSGPVVAARTVFEPMTLFRLEAAP